MITTRKTLLGTAIAVALAPIAAQGAGFGLNSHSAKSGGTSHAGTAVMAEDPATVFYNPAGMVLNDKAAVSVGGAYIMPEFDYSDEGSETSSGAPVPGETSATSDEAGFAPSFYYMTPFRDDWAVGISINAPYGSSTKFSDDWVGRYNGTESDIRGVNINPNIAHRINDKVSIGFGVNAQYFDATLTSMTPTGAAVARDAGVTAFEGLGGEQGRLYSGDYDTESKVEGDSWAVGYNLGVLIEPTQSTRIGLAYRSEISHGLDGDISFDPQTQQAEVFASAAGLEDGPASTSVEVPESATLSVSQGFGENDRLTVLADAQYTRWSRVDTINIEAGLGDNNPELALDFKNSWRGSLGATWEQTDQLTLRAGYTFEESAVRSDESRTPRVPDNNRNWVSIGAGYQFANGVELDASYSHLFIKDTGINNDSGSGTTLNGEFESSADILSLQATYRY
ncbi:MAG: OmpP1/FadL family transporter [Pseudomonadota bacterium]